MGHFRVYDACISSTGQPDRETKPGAEEGASPQDRRGWWTATRLGPPLAFHSVLHAQAHEQNHWTDTEPDAFRAQPAKARRMEFLIR